MHLFPRGGSVDNFSQSACYPPPLDFLNPMPRTGGVCLALGGHVEACSFHALDDVLDPPPTHLAISCLLKKVNRHRSSLLGLVQRRYAEHMTYQTNNTTQLLWISQC